MEQSREEAVLEPSVPKELDPRPYLYEAGSNRRFGPASQESIQAYVAALKKGGSFFMYPYHGYQLKMVVRDGSDDDGMGLQSRNL